MKNLSIAVLAVIVAAPFTAAQPGSQDQSQSSSISDANLAAVIKTTNDGEIRESKVAEKKAQSKAVKKFAKMMVKDHSDNNSELASISKKIGLQPSFDEQTTAMKQQAQQASQTLESASGADFDSAYIDQMIKDHTAALQKLEDAISSNSGRNEQLDGLLKKTRQKVSQHLEEAKRIQSDLGSGRSGDMNSMPENKSGY